MPFCTACGSQLLPEARFCVNCGSPVIQYPAQPAPVQQPVQEIPTPDMDLSLYEGGEKKLSFMGVEFTVSKEMDVFAHYRREFRRFARVQTAALRGEYFRRVFGLDAFLTDFPVMYTFYRQPILDKAMDLFAETGLYDISPSQFEEQHTKDFCLCGEDIDVMIDSFNQTIEMNQERKAQGYNMLPGMVFSGIGGFVTAMAVNVAINKIAEDDIRNANVTPQQRAELFARINTDVLLERAFLDYWRVFLSMTWWMNRRGLPVWYPNEDGNQRATAFYQNLSAGRIPEHKQPEAVVQMLQLNPFMDDNMKYISQKYGMTDEITEILTYFGMDEI